MRMVNKKRQIFNINLNQSLSSCQGLMYCGSLVADFVLQVFGNYQPIFRVVEGGFLIGNYTILFQNSVFVCFFRVIFYSTHVYIHI